MIDLWRHRSIKKAAQNWCDFYSFAAVWSCSCLTAKKAQCSRKWKDTEIRSWKHRNLLTLYPDNFFDDGEIRSATKLPEEQLFIVQSSKICGFQKSSKQISISAISRGEMPQVTWRELDAKPLRLVPILFIIPWRSSVNWSVLERLYYDGFFQEIESNFYFCFLSVLILMFKVG